MRKVGSLLAIAAAASSLAFVAGGTASATEQAQASPLGRWVYIGPWEEDPEGCKQSKANSFGKPTSPAGPDCAKGVNAGVVIYYYYRWEE
ncbi:hypothetical protein [Amycolatopsis suaedae]|uniref:Uncharacterized protein n=1 Tax=Amycolatopsis suaedae TaxID=2510978 RepID=A0A4Q7JB74_9PSEU|nr:hypothetical protein [Amycolatopsis suaedae]RZQ63743.1 hypothetical protein EWH70_11275 [Amycolatopsis suaedae]